LGKNLHRGKKPFAGKNIKKNSLPMGSFALNEKTNTRQSAYNSEQQKE
jgi:hypothetical protein